MFFQVALIVDKIESTIANLNKGLDLSFIFLTLLLFWSHDEISLFFNCLLKFQVPSA